MVADISTKIVAATIEALFALSITYPVVSQLNRKISYLNVERDCCRVDFSQIPHVKAPSSFKDRPAEET